MNKRDFLKKSLFFSMGTFAAGNLLAHTSGASAIADFKGDGPFELPDLPYAYDALTPYIDEETMTIHHTKHHAGYTRKLNNAVKEAGLEGKSIRELLENVSSYPTAVRQNGGGYYNHKIFWKMMSPDGGGTPPAPLADAINEEFGSFEAFKEEFSKAAGSRFGSGWAWLVKTDSGLKVTSTPNQDNTLMDIADVKGEPLLGIDVWEHAYYLKYQNRRGEYIDAFWNLVDWNYVNERFQIA